MIRIHTNEGHHDCEFLIPSKEIDTFMFTTYPGGKEFEFGDVGLIQQVDSEPTKRKRKSPEPKTKPSNTF